MKGGRGKVWLLSLCLVLLVALCTCVSYNPVANPKAVVKFGNARFTVLTPTLIRMEALRKDSPSNTFDDRPTLDVVNRYTDQVPHFTTSYPNPSTVVIQTSDLTLTYINSKDSNTSVCQNPQNHTDQSGGTRVPDHPHHLTAGSWEQCCSYCFEDTYCTAWVFDPPEQKFEKGFCWLMMGVTGTYKHENRVFGEVSAFNDANLNVKFNMSTADGKGTKTVTWTPSSKNVNNLHGTLDAMDCYSTPTQCYGEYLATFNNTVGLLSKDGWYLLDDSSTARYTANIAPELLDTIIPWYNENLTDHQDLYLFTGGLNYRQTLADYRFIGGAITLPPRTALGVWWSRYYEYSQQTFTDEVLDGYAKYQLPLAQVVLDMDWHIEPDTPGCQSWGGYTFNTKLFPNPEQFISWLHSKQNPLGYELKLLLNVHPQTGVDHCQGRYAEMAYLNGINPKTNETVPCNFGNYTFMKTLFDVYLDAQPLAGVDSYWTDYGGCGGATNDANSNDRSLFWSNYVFDTHLQQHYKGEKRPLVLSRYGGLGNHRYPIGFSGDTFQAFQTLEWEIQMTQTAANVLFGWWSHDIGGFHTGKDCPGDGNPQNITGSELLLRWLQFGSVAPIFRTHCDHCERRIWKFQYHFYWMSHAMFLRNGLVPYTYTFGKESAFNNGVALVHPLYYDWATVPEAYSFDHQYMFGDSILAAPIYTPTSNATRTTVHRVWLPSGTWSNWNGTALHRGPTVVTQAYGWQDIPLFVKPGDIIPLQTNASVVSNFADPLIWTVLPGANTGAGRVWEDDGNSDDYLKEGNGAVTQAVYSGSVESGNVEVKIGASTGGFRGMPSRRSHMVQLRGAQQWAKRDPSSVTVNGQSVSKGPNGWYFAAEYGLVLTEGSLVIHTGSFPTSTPLTVSVRF